jgi:hypothetical protein
LNSSIHFHASLGAPQGASAAVARIQLGIIINPVYQRPQITFPHSNAVILSGSSDSPNSAVFQKVEFFAAPFQKDVHYWMVAQFA